MENIKEQFIRLYAELDLTDDQFAMLRKLERDVYAELSKTNISKNYPWLNKDDLEFAIALYKKNRLDAVKFLTSLARPHSLTPFKVAKEILDTYNVFNNID